MLVSGVDTVLPLDESMAHAVGRLLGRSGTADIADATVVTAAIAMARRRTRRPRA
jgi:hypothetical protein